MNLPLQVWDILDPWLAALQAVAAFVWPLVVLGLAIFVVMHVMNRWW